MKTLDKVLIGLNMFTMVAGAGRIADSIDSSDYDTQAATAAEYHMNNGETVSATEAKAFSDAKSDKQNGLTGTFQLLLGLSGIALVAASSSKKQDSAPIVRVPANPKCKFES